MDVYLRNHNMFLYTHRSLSHYIQENASTAIQTQKLM